MFTTKRLTSALVALVALAFTSPAIAQTVAEEFIYYPSGPNEYYLFSQMDEKKVVDYETDRMVRVCMNSNRHLVPLRVHHDQEESLVQPGDCLRVEAKQVRLEPAGRLEPEWNIRAEVETLEG